MKTLSNVPHHDHELQVRRRTSDAHEARWSAAAVLHATDDRLVFVQRIVFAAIMLPHGAQHALGWFGGYGFAGTYGWMTRALGIPAPFAALAIVTEVVAPLFLLAGLGGRVAAAGLAAILAVAATTHASNGFFMNWVGANAGEGYEYHLLGVALAASVIVRGSGAYSLDRLLGRARSSHATSSLASKAGEGP